MIRINKSIDLMEQGEPAYVTMVMSELSYDVGKEWAKTWADILWIDFEYMIYDLVGLSKFMRGLKDGGPTASGHATPVVVVSPPMHCRNPEEVYSNGWQIRALLMTGIHGFIYPQAQEPEAVKAYVATTRFASQTIGRERGLPEGYRGHGGERIAAEIWVISPQEYVVKADPWPLNPDGELLLGLKIEDQQGLDNANAIASTPGINLAIAGMGDMAMSLGYQKIPPWPFPPDMVNAWNTVQSACDNAGIPLHTGWPEPSITEDQLPKTDEEIMKFLIEDNNAKIIRVSEELTAIGRRVTGRKMPV